ncbi:MAG: zinc-dependent alcohol dehydrogenase family protein [Gammaproteobacteria bacterium]|nr:zinc-dependent alcohol dehydrogenase family protein [Gammaproteobacteria bacterium]
MKAVLMTAVGEPEVLEYREIPDPDIAVPTQIKVRLRAAGVNPVDTKMRRRGLYFPGSLPAVLGCDGAGIVVETGAAVTRFNTGDEVWFCDGGAGGDPGCYAEYKVIDQDVARLKPAALNFTEAAAAPLVMITAWEALFARARVQAGQSVLIHGGTGGVGHVAIQLAKRAGAQVCVTVGSPDKVAYARGLGADETILYSERDFVQAVNEWTGGRGVDVALDTVGGEVFRRTIEAVAHYGDLVTLLDPGADVAWREARNRNLRIGFEFMLIPMLRGLADARRRQGEMLDRCREWCDEGALKIDVARVLPLEWAAEAHRLIEQGHTRGKVVLEIAD